MRNVYFRADCILGLGGSERGLVVLLVLTSCLDEQDEGHNTLHARVKYNKAMCIIYDIHLTKSQYLHFYPEFNIDK